MSVLGATTAVISIGLSCQAAIQIKGHAMQLAQLLGEPVARSRMPFDWVLAPPAVVSAMLEDGRTFPDRPDELELVPKLEATVLRWQSRGPFHFWHDFIVDGRLDFAAGFAQSRSVYAHAYDKFGRLAEKARRIFVLANSQNDLPRIARRTELPFVFTPAAVAGLVARVNALFSGPNEFIVVTSEDRAEAIADWPVRPHVIEPGESLSKENFQAWSQVFAAHFAGSEVRGRAGGGQAGADARAPA